LWLGGWAAFICSLDEVRFIHPTALVAAVFPPLVMALTSGLLASVPSTRVVAALIVARLTVFVSVV
jgi:hypothetical protein